MEPLVAYSIGFVAFVIMTLACLVVNFHIQSSEWGRLITWWVMWLSFIGTIVMLIMVAFQMGEV